MPASAREVFRATRLRVPRREALGGQAHRSWLGGLVFDNETDRVVVDEYKTAIDQAERRLKAMDAELERAAALPLYREHVAWLRSSTASTRRWR
jgi:hypothetical protein